MLASRAGRALRRFTLAAAVAAVAVPWGPLPDAGHADATAKWRAAHTEEFSGDSLPDGCGAYSGTDAAGESHWTADDVRLSRGLLRLTLRERTVKGLRWTSGGVGCWGWAGSYGRYEVRAKAPAGKGVRSYLGLWPVTGAENASTGVALLAPGEETARVTNGYGGGTETAPVPGRYSDGFHTYVIEWTPSATRILVDDRVIHRSSHSYDGPRWLGMVVGRDGAATGVRDAPSTLPAEFQIDYVRVSSFAGAPVARSTVNRPSRKRPATVTVSPSASAPSGAGDGGGQAMPVPAGAAATATPAPGAVRAGQGLAGGVWPWLIGGGVIAVLAIVVRTPRGRRVG